MKKLITFLFLLNNLAFFSQQWTWAKEIGAYSTMGQSAIKANVSGDLFIVSNITFQSSHTLLRRVNSTGQVTWSTSIDGWNTCLMDVSVDKNNNSYVLGFFASNLVFPDTTMWEGNSWEIFIAAYDPAGNRKWVKTFTDCANWGNFITNDSNGDLIYASAKGWTISKYDQNGTLIWQNNLACNNYINGLKVDCNNNIYLTGSFTDSLVINNTNYYSSPFYSSYGYGFICKLNTSGIMTNIRAIQGASFSDLGIDSLNNYYAVGSFVDSMRIGQTVITNTCSSTYGCPKSFFAKFDSTNNCVWIKQGFNSFDKIEVTKSGSCYVAGSFKDTLALSNITLYEVNNRHAVYISYFNAAGAALWAVKDGNTNYASNFVTCLSHSNNGYVFVGGMFEGQTWFGNNSITNNSNIAHYFAASLNENALPTSLSAIEKKELLTEIYPNPGNGKFSLTNNEAIITGIYDVYGRAVTKISTSQTGADLSGNAKGIYFIELMQGNKKEFKKIIIE
ncbi:MAG: T9SS type A sorting domain-containing protein [Bacteroidia bacterium]